MDEQRIERALRDGPLDEPAYLPRASRVVDIDEQAFEERVETGGARSRPAARASRADVGRLGWLLPLAAVITVAIVGMVVRTNLGPGASPSPAMPDLLGRINEDGVVHIAVSNAAPQTQTTGNAYVGFDIDVANQVAAWLGARPDIQLASPEEIMRGNGGWELSFPSHNLPDALSGVLVGPSYYTWPAWLVVQAASPIDAMAALDGAAICVVEGSRGADWLTGTAAADTTFVTSAPVDLTIVSRVTDQGCLDALDSGDTAAAVTAALLDVDFASRGVRAITGSPVLRQQRAVLVRDASAFGDPTALQAAVTAAITNLRTSGQLAELSRRAFGGQDLTGDLP